MGVGKDTNFRLFADVINEWPSIAKLLFGLSKILSSLKHGN